MAGLTAGWSRKDLSVRDAAATAAILGLYTAMLTYIVVVYAHAFRTGFILGFKVAGAAGMTIFIVGFYHYARHGRRIRVDVDNTISLNKLRSVLLPIEGRAAELLIGDVQWTVNSHVRPRGNGVTVDLHELDVSTAIALLEVLVAVRNEIGRVQLVTGRGKAESQNTEMRPAVSEWLRRAGAATHWELLRKQHAITLRPRRPPLAHREMLLRVSALGLPIGAIGAIGFDDASNGIPGATLFGGISGMFLAYLLVTHAR